VCDPAPQFLSSPRRSSPTEGVERVLFAHGHANSLPVTAIGVKSAPPGFIQASVRDVNAK
jgi:hypothetical protein